MYSDVDFHVAVQCPCKQVSSGRKSNCRSTPQREVFGSVAPEEFYLNERTTVAVENKIWGTVVFRQIAGAVARRIVMYAKPGDMAAQGSEFGFIKFGSRVDVFLPLDSKILVKEGDVVKGAKTVLAERS